MREYYSRVLAYIACGASIAAGTYTQYFSYGILWMVPYALLYPHLAYHLGQRFRQHDPRKVTRALLAVDAVHCGLGMALLGFSVVPSLMFLLVLSFTALVIGGLRLLGMALLVSASSALLVAVLVAPPLLGNTPVEVAAVSILFCGLYICITAFFGHQQGLRLAQVRQEIAREQEKAARLARNLAKYLSPQVWEMIFSGKKSVRLETQRKKLTVFFSDIRGFTELSEELEAEALTDLLNNYLNEMSKIALKYGGTIDKFVGDCVMVFFGDPSTQGAKKDAVAAVSMGIAMRKHMKVLRQQWRAQGITKPLEIRMGINTGYCTVGNFGADTRMDYTIIGREVNLASRLESASEAGEILISTRNLLADQGRDHVPRQGPDRGQGLQPPGADLPGGGLAPRPRRRAQLRRARIARLLHVPGHQQHPELRQGTGHPGPATGRRTPARQGHPLSSSNAAGSSSRHSGAVRGPLACSARNSSAETRQDCSRAQRPQAWRSSASAWRQASPRSSCMTPVTPCCNTSSGPGTAKAATGTPQARASSITRP